MKLRNIICFLILIFCGVLAGCGNKEKIEKNITSVDYLNIKFELEENLYVGDSFDLSDYVEISTSLKNPLIEFGCEDEEIIKFTGNTFSCIKEGETYILVRGKLAEGKYVYAREKVVVENVPLFYTSFSLQKSVVEVDYKNRENITNIATFVGESTYPVLVEYSNDILTYDYQTGLLDITSVGECRVTVKVPISRDENRVIQYTTYSFDVIVDRYITNVTLKGSSGGINLKVGEIGQFLLDISPTKYTVDAPVITSSSDIIEIDGTNYEAVTAGECKLTVSYQTSAGVTHSKEYTVRIYEEPSLLTLGVYDGTNIVEGDLEVGKEYKLIVSSECDLGNFTTLIVNNVDPATLSGVTVSDAKLSDGRVEYKFTIESAMNVNFQIGYYKDTYSSTLTCMDVMLSKNVISA